MFAATLAAPAFAARIEVAPAAAPLQAIVDTAAEGDVIVLRSGTHRGPVEIGKTLTLDGDPGARIEGDGSGSVVVVAAKGVIVRDLEIAGSGRDLEAMDAGVFVTKAGQGSLIENNDIIGNLYGIYLHGARDAIARGNRIVGLREGRSNEAGNGISVWNAPGAKVIDNDIRYGRDGIYVVTSRNNLFEDNRFRDLRFAVHYMYTNDSVIRGNRSLGNAVGFAIMYSDRLTITGNRSDGDRDHGLLLNYANGSQIAGNVVLGRLQPAERWRNAGRLAGTAHAPVGAVEPVPSQAAGMRLGPEKCVFMYNANRNRFRGNRFEGCQIGIHFTAGSEGNEIAGNAFIANRNQVKYVGTRNLDWSSGGRGNFWSDNPAFDLDGDGLADNPYRPNDLVDKVLWTAPSAKILLTSPATQVIRWAQSQFPAVLPGGVVDSFPLMTAPVATLEAPE
ncbi:nitrous oxide reductase family maturation protein NosD [Nitratireductor sp. ZSWI3]|uniref:nitrous oxide reductase family maturation protein NosD n=1 Tax=Nitratireductor sp. ZSWI3 TaxID=2966359 RepID=UPI00214FEEF7|nr:nitrous oxide reductase family maturation protein NosD [Nitratireductor sp. ZSWI3]MCR4269257.1 nitrous oxide reductase family maturation protein NosD [Nitratireductor sp. ZSWI3]